MLADVRRWPRWDLDLASPMLDGPVAVGATGRRRPTGWLAGRLHARVAAPFRLTECAAHRSIVIDQPILAGVMRFELHLETASAGTVLRQRLSLTGPLRRAMALVIGRRHAGHASVRARHIEALCRDVPTPTPGDRPHADVRALPAGSKPALPSGSASAGSGDRWLLMAVRGHVGGTPPSPNPSKGTGPGRPFSEFRAHVSSSQSATEAGGRRNRFWR